MVAAKLSAPDDLLRQFEDHMSTASGIVREIFRYSRTRRKYVFLPILIVLLLLGALVVFAQGSVLAPFIYTIV